MSEKSVVVCRPNKSLIVGTIVAGGLVCFPLGMLIACLVAGPPRTRAEWEGLIGLLGLLAVLTGTPVLWIGAFLARARVTADALGLCQQSLRRRAMIRWEDVTDYYCETVKNTSNGRADWVYVVRAGKSQIRIPSGGWTNVPEFRESVRQRATAAKARDWRERQVRSEDWPQSFRYNASPRFNTPALLVRWHGMTLAAVVLYFAYRWVTTHTLPGWGWLLTPTGLFLVGKEVFLLLLHPTCAETHRRLGQRITVSREGLVFEDGPRRVASAWDEVSSFYMTGLAVPRYVVETERGDFDFLNTLRGASVLQKQLCRFATRAGQTEWRVRAAVPSARRPGSGRVYTYQTPAVQEFASTPTLLSLVVLGLVAATALGTMTSGAVLSPAERGALVLAVALVAAMTWAAWRYRSAFLRLDEHGVTQATAFGLRFVPWEQVREFYWTGSGEFQRGHVVGTYARIHFWGCIAGAEEVKAEIARRAVNSRNRTWDDSPRTRQVEASARE